MILYCTYSSKHFNNIQHHKVKKDERTDTLVVVVDPFDVCAAVGGKRERERKRENQERELLLSVVVAAG
jgi:hypothetical protein